MNSAATVCISCAEPLVDPERPCGFCDLDRRRQAIEFLCNSLSFGDNLALLHRVEGIWLLYELGYSKADVTMARAQALDGHPVDRILEGLGEPSAVSGAAA